MKFSVACKNCKKTFAAQSERYGRLRYRCPYCGATVTCELRESLPVVEAKPISGSKSKPKPARQTASSIVDKGKATLRYTSASLNWTSNKIAAFQSRYDDGDLWLFFSFSLLFVLAVIGGLYLFAWCAKLIVTGHSWLFKLYLDIAHSF